MSPTIRPVKSSAKDTPSRSRLPTLGPSSQCASPIGALLPWLHETEKRISKTNGSFDFKFLPLMEQSSGAWGRKSTFKFFFKKPNLTPFGVGQNGRNEQTTKKERDLTR